MYQRSDSSIIDGARCHFGYGGGEVVRGILSKTWGGQATREVTPAHYFLHHSLYSALQPSIQPSIPTSVSTTLFVSNPYAASWSRRTTSRQSSTRAREKPLTPRIRRMSTPPNQPPKSLQTARRRVRRTNHRKVCL